jgi:hypothetical protein
VRYYQALNDISYRIMCLLMADDHWNIGPKLLQWGMNVCFLVLSCNSRGLALADLSPKEAYAVYKSSILSD